MPNTELLKKTLAHIEAHPEQWNQEMWANECSTTFCFAGHAVLQAGCHILAARELVDWTTVPKDILTMVRGYGSHPTIRQVAIQLLDLDYNQAADLFGCDNSLGKLRELVAEMCAAASEASS